MKWSLKGRHFDLLSNSLHQFFMESIEMGLENLYVDIETQG